MEGLLVGWLKLGAKVGILLGADVVGPKVGAKEGTFEVGVDVGKAEGPGTEVMGMFRWAFCWNTGGRTFCRGVARFLCWSTNDRLKRRNAHRWTFRWKERRTTCCWSFSWKHRWRG